MNEHRIHGQSEFRASDYLTLDLILLGPATFGAAAYLRDYFQQATERDVDVETVPCRDTETAINTFGNLLSSMAIYDNVDDCQTLMGAFKGRRLVQPRGRFMKHPVQSETDVSRLDPERESLETSGCPDSAKASGRKPPPCHVCGCETVSIGLIVTGQVKAASCGRVKGGQEVGIE